MLTPGNRISCPATGTGPGGIANEQQGIDRLTLNKQIRNGSVLFSLMRAQRRKWRHSVNARPCQRALAWLLLDATLGGGRVGVELAEKGGQSPNKKRTPRTEFRKKAKTGAWECGRCLGSGGGAPGDPCRPAICSPSLKRSSTLLPLFTAQQSRQGTENSVVDRPPEKTLEPDPRCTEPGLRSSCCWCAQPLPTNSSSSNTPFGACGCYHETP